MSEHTLTVDIVTPRRVVYSGVADAVTLPGVKGAFQVLFNHAPIVSALDLGVIKVLNNDGSETCYATDGGFAEVLRNVISVAVETAEEASEIDLERLRKERAALAEQLEREQILSLRDELKNQLHRLDNRIRVAQM
ncbi:ATP synthase F1 subunit epsilon [Ignavibacteria bacterium]|nr:ATP synthase F1 subunit epsilon [Bacteroidota bacterium]MCZ2132136.1 ATP synthase F1 subunit epsilon [Bacteroidota bacterium]